MRETSKHKNKKRLNEEKHYLDQILFFQNKLEAQILGAEGPRKACWSGGPPDSGSTSPLLALKQTTGPLGALASCSVERVPQLPFTVMMR